MTLLLTLLDAEVWFLATQFKRARWGEEAMGTGTTLRGLGPQKNHMGGDKGRMVGTARISTDEMESLGTGIDQIIHFQTRKQDEISFTHILSLSKLFLSPAVIEELIEK